MRRTHVGPALMALADMTAGMRTSVALGDQEDLFAGDSASYRRCLRSRKPVHEYMRMTTGAAETTTMERLLLPCQDAGGGAHQLVGMVYFASVPDAPPAVSMLDAMTVAQIDALPFGVIKLDRDGLVQRYSEVERQHSGYNLGSPVGLEFFSVVAPCMNTARIRGRIEQGICDGVFDAEFSHVGDFNDARREMTIRAYSATDGGVWITHTRQAE
jgi:photoactive yellow protein